jgi:hypothetical protein
MMGVEDYGRKSVIQIWPLQRAFTILAIRAAAV